MVEYHCLYRDINHEIQRKDVINMKVFKRISVVVLMMICILTFTVKTNAAEGFRVDPCATTTCHGEYINGFCNVCDSYEAATLSDDVYLISNAGQLYWFINEINSGNVGINAKLTKNIIINEGNVIGCNGVKDSKWRNWLTNEDNAYTGVFDGNGFYISGIYSSTNNVNANIGLLGETNGATIQNLGIINSYFEHNNYGYIGGFVGFAKHTTFTNCYIEATFIGKEKTYGYIGGFVGLDGDGNFTNCYANVTIDDSNGKSDVAIGGLIGSGYYNGGYITKAAVSASIKAPAGVVKAGSVVGNTRGITHKDTYYDKDRYATGIGTKYDEVAPEGITNGVSSTAFTDGTICQTFNYHLYKFVSTATQHYQECVICGDKTAAKDHSIGKAAACKELAVCATCGESYGEYDHTKHLSDEFDDEGFSLCCGYGYEPTTLVTEDNYTALGLTSDYVGYHAIGNAGQLLYFTNGIKNDYDNFKSINVVLISDIDVNPGYTFNSDGTVSYNNATVTSGWRTWTPIGAFENCFIKTFDGNYHTISGLYVNDETMKYVGVFGELRPGKVCNLGVLNSYFNAQQYVGGISGHASFAATVENCYSYATVSAEYGGGGIVSAGTSSSKNPAVNIINCYYNGVLKPKGTTYMSGIYGGSNAAIENSYYNSDNCKYGNTKYAMSDADFKSGVVAYLLNGDQSTITYGQTIGTEDYPVFGGARVYGGYENCESDTLIATNDSSIALNPTTGHAWEYSASGTTITATCTQPVCSIGDRTETITIEALDISSLTYNGETKPIKVIESVVGLIPYQVEYVDGNSNQLFDIPKLIGTYTGSITLGDQTISVTYEITKAVLEGTPEASVEFGRNPEETEITGTVYIKDTTIEVDGTWSWVSGGVKAIFTPTDQTTHNVLEETAVVIKSIADDPILTVISPVADIAPGQSVYITYSIVNKYDSNITDLPTQYTYTYRVDEGVETEFTDGLLAIPMDTPIGSKIYVTVTTTSVENKYNAVSETIEILVAGNSGSVTIGDNGNWFIDGQDSGKSAIGTIVEIGDNGNWFIDGTDTGKKVDYTADIDAINQLLTQEIERLQALIESNDTDIENINKSINSINETIKALDEAYKLADADLAKAIEDAKQTLMDAANKALETESTRLQALIESNDTDIENINKSINSINETIKALDEAYKLADTNLQTLIETTKANLETSLDNTSKLMQEKLDAAVKELEAVDKENSEALTKAVQELKDLIAAAEALAQTNDAALKTDLEGQLTTAKEALTDAINKVQENLDAAVKELEAVDKENSEALTKAVQELKDLIAAAEALAQTNDAALKTDLEGQLTTAKEALTDAINKVQENLDVAVKELDEKITAGDAANSLELAIAVEQLNKAIQVAQAVAKSNDAALKADLEAQLAVAKDELNKAITKVQENLDAAVKELEAQLAASNEANALELSKAVEELEALIEAAKALSKTDDEALKAELMNTITTLQNEWLSKFSDLLAKLESARQESEKNDAALKEELLEDTDKAVILPTVVAFIAVAGNVGLLVWIIIDRKRRA